jgi:hypothetical protein
MNFLFPKTPEERRQTDDEYHRRSERQQWVTQNRLIIIQNRIQNRSAVFSLIAAIGAIVAAGFAGCAYQQAKRQADISDDQERRSLRAYVIMPFVEDEKHPPNHLLINRDGTVEGWQAAKNVGQTPAYNIANYIAIRSLPRPLPLVFSFPTQKHYNQPSIEQQSTEFWNIYSRDFNVLAEAAELKSWRKAIYLYGTIFYDDVFGHHHWSNYCYYFLPDAWVTTDCDTHNDSDDSENAHDASIAP